MSIPDELRVALFQFSPREDGAGTNARRILAAREEAAAAGAALVLCPEFSLAEVSPGRSAPVAEFEHALAGLARSTADGGPGLVVGGPWRENGRLFGALFVLDGGAVLARRLLHGGAPFLDGGPEPGPVSFRGVRLGLMAGGDWRGPAVSETLAESGAEMLVALEGAPFGLGEPERRVDRAVARVVENGLPFVFLNRVGGRNERVFDGASFALNADRSPALRMPVFAEALAVTRWARTADGWRCDERSFAPPVDGAESIWRALVLALRERVESGGHSGVLVALTGRAEEALSAALAVDALGAERVRCAVSGPAGEAGRWARALGARVVVPELEPAAAALSAALAGVNGGPVPAASARLRDAALLALADASGELLLATASRTALAVGRGAARGGFSVMAGLYDEAVLALARWRDANRPGGPAMPDGWLAGGGPGEGGLPAAGTLDAILHGLREGGRSVDALVTEGYHRAEVLAVQRRLDRTERDRRLLAPGVRVGPHAPGREAPDARGLRNIG